MIPDESVIFRDGQGGLCPTCGHPKETMGSCSNGFHVVISEPPVDKRQTPLSLTDKRQKDPVLAKAAEQLALRFNYYLFNEGNHLAYKGPKEAFDYLAYCIDRGEIPGLISEQSAMNRKEVAEILSTKPYDDGPLVFLEMAGRGCISGNVSEWAQLKPACRWAATEIKTLRATLSSSESQLSLVENAADVSLKIAQIEKDKAYTERNKLVAAFSKLFPASLERHVGEAFDPGWEWVVIVDLPTGQVSWHIHNRELSLFDHLLRETGRTWDGHTTDEKYERLNNLKVGPV